MIYVLDTDTCIYWLNGKTQIKAKVTQIGTSRLRTTIVTVAELRYGAYKSQRVTENLQKSDDFLKKVKILPLDRAAADTFGRLKAELHRQGTPLSDFDLLIAAMTLRYDGILVTNNIAHFEKVAGLHYENWL